MRGSWAARAFLRRHPPPRPPTSDSRPRRNRPSRRVAEKLGLRDEGVAQRFLQIRGVYEDHVRYAITREEWDERGPEIARQLLS